MSDPVGELKGKSNKDFLAWLSENLDKVNYSYHVKQYLKIRLYNISQYIDKKKGTTG